MSNNNDAVVVTDLLLEAERHTAKLENRRAAIVRAFRSGERTIEMDAHLGTHEEVRQRYAELEDMATMRLPGVSIPADELGETSIFVMRIPVPR